MHFWEVGKVFDNLFCVLQVRSHEFGLKKSIKRTPDVLSSLGGARIGARCGDIAIRILVMSIIVCGVFVWINTAACLNKALGMSAVQLFQSTEHVRYIYMHIQRDLRVPFGLSTFPSSFFIHFKNSRDNLPGNVFEDGNLAVSRGILYLLALDII